jgi:hypothetical protein
MSMRNRVSICTLIIGLICPFTQAARGQESGPVQPPPATMVEGPQEERRTSMEGYFNAQELPKGITKEDLAMNNKLFFEV